MYQYEATLRRILDGDTIDVSVDLGYETFQYHKLRLVGINAPETGTVAGGEATAYITTLLAPTLYLRTIKAVTKYDPPTDKADSFKRYLAWVWTEQAPMEAAEYRSSINYQMVATGHAVEYMTPPEWPT
jgi:endonuclease YncB( thermonuclease family)